jgi:hypothetical protein
MAGFTGRLPEDVFSDIHQIFEEIPEQTLVAVSNE